jgi:hypothetical protein
MDFIQLAVKVGLDNAEKLWVVGAIMVSAIIFLVGTLKYFAFDKIKNKDLRKSVVAFSNIALSFGATSLYFLIEHINWRWYWVGAVITSITCIVIYWFYENSHLRELIHKIGSFAIDKFAYLAKVILAKLVAKTDKSVEQEFKKVTSELKTFAKNEMQIATKKLKSDREFSNL